MHHLEDFDQATEPTVRASGRHGARQALDTTDRLESAGWTVIRVWEHDEPSAAAERIALLMRSRRADESS